MQDMFNEWRDDWRTDAHRAQLAERQLRAKERDKEAAEVRRTGADASVASAVSAASARLTPAQRSLAEKRAARQRVEQSPLASLARRIAACEQRLQQKTEELREQFAASGCDIDAAAVDEDGGDEDVNARDAYADARCGAPIWQRWPLLARHEMPLRMRNGMPLCDEQQRACRTIAAEPIVILTGRGGGWKWAEVGGSGSTLTHRSLWQALAKPR